MSVSIIIPVYNVLSYLKEAIDSVLEQISANDEVIIVDDGSTDGSGKLVDNLYSNHDQVIILHTTNHGLGGARNNGLRVASKEFVYYFDSDDILSKSLFSSFNRAHLKISELDLFVFSARSFHDVESEVKLPEYDRGVDGIFNSGEDAFSYLYSKDKCYPNAWMYITRRSVIENNNLLFKDIIHEDEEYTPRLFKVCGVTLVTKNVYFNRRVRANSIMQTKYSERNVIGYLESIKSQLRLANQSSGLFKKMVEKRIINNLGIIRNIIAVSGVALSSKTKEDLENVERTISYCPVKIMKFSYFLYRVYRFFEVKLRGRVVVDFKKL